VVRLVEGAPSSETRFARCSMGPRVERGSTRKIRRCSIARWARNHDSRYGCGRAPQPSDLHERTSVFRRKPQFSGADLSAMFRARKVSCGPSPPQFRKCVIAGNRQSISMPTQFATPAARRASMVGSWREMPQKGLPHDFWAVNIEVRRVMPTLLARRTHGVDFGRNIGITRRRYVTVETECQIAAYCCGRCGPWRIAA
jgi:hypothetical protein